MKRILLILALASLLLLSSSPLIIREIGWSAITGGGGYVSTGDTTLISAIGQPVAWLTTTSDSTLCSGFLCGILANNTVYLPLVRK